MKSRSTRLFALALCLALLAVLFPVAPRAQAAGTVYSGYTTLAMIYDQSDCYSMQGFGIYGNYLYSIKANTTTNANACIARTHKDTGATTYLTNSATGTKYFDYFGHANDLDMANVAGQPTMFIASASTGNHAIVRLVMNSSSTAMTKVGNYNVTVGGAEAGFGGVNVLHVDSEYVTLLFKAGNSIYTGKVGVNQTSGTIEATKLFSIDLSDVDFGGTHRDLSAWVGQGFEYHDNQIYIPMTGNHATETIANSAVIVYDLEGASGTIRNNPACSFWFESKDFPGLFEIESLGIAPYDGKMYFATNSRKSSSQTNYDAVHVVNSFVYQANQRPGTVGNYRWEVTNDALVPTVTQGNSYNGLVMHNGSVSGGVLSGARYCLSEPVILQHSLPWIVEWKASGTGNNAMLFSTESSSNIAEQPYLFRSTECTMLALGVLSGGKNHNYGISLADHGIDGTAEHVYRLTNKIAADGSNMVYLSVDGVELGAMNNYFVGLTAQNTTSDWVSGKDFKFSYIGTYEYAVSSTALSYLQVWGNGLKHQADEPDIYRWETGTDAMESVSGFGLTQNTPTVLHGSVVQGIHSGSQYQLARDVVLLHQRPWVVEWQSEGNFTGGSMLLAAHLRSNALNAPFLFRYSGSSFLGIGSFTGDRHTSYGYTLSDLGIDGNASHIYRLTNQIAADGSNMIYLSIDGKEIGPMNREYQGITDLGTTSDALSGRDFTFSYMGTWQNKLNDASIGYFQVWENGIPADHTPAAYRWEMETGGFASVTSGEFAENPISTLYGTVSGGTVSGANLRLEKPLVLCHDKAWSVQWQSGGSSGTTGSAEMLLASSNYNNEPNSGYLLRRGDGNFIALGVRSGSAHYNYGITLSDYGIDASQPHSYRLTNKIAADGTNMVYLSVDDRELGPLNNKHVGLNNQNATSDWVSGKDFIFSFVGTYNYPIQNDALSFLQVNEGCTHSFGPWNQTDPTCTENGSKTRTCSLCGYGETETLPASGHSYSAAVTPPTCTEGGYTTYTCTRCSDSYVDDRVAALDHSYATAVTPPTCSEPGYTTYTCTRCSHSYTGSATTPKGHNYEGVVTEPTCTEDGYTTYTCSKCADSYVSDRVAALDHSYTAVVTPPACTRNGYTTYTCTRCSHSYVGDYVTTSGHNYESVVTQPTCTEGGYTTYTCSKCSDSYVRDRVDALGHSYRDGICGVCGGADPDYVAPADWFSLVGDMNNWDHTANIMTGDGVVTATVSLDQGSYQFKIRYGDTYYGNDGIVINTTDTTCAEGWDMSTTAGNCTLQASGGDYTFRFDTQTLKLIITCDGNETEDDPVPTGTITLKSVTLSLEDEVLYNLYYEISDMNVAEADMGMILWDQEPVQPTINGGGTVIPGSTYVPVSGRYAVTSMGIPAKDMGDLKYMVVYARLPDGSYVYSKVLSYCARSYCLSRLEKSDDELLRSLCVSLMNYGASAQEYFAENGDYTYDTLMNVGFEAYQDKVLPYAPGMLNPCASVDTAKAGSLGTALNGFTKRSASLSADGNFALNYYFTASQAAEEVTFYYWTEAKYASVTQLTPDNASGSVRMTPTGNTNQYWANYSGIPAKALDKTIYACGIYEKDGVTYSTGVFAYSLGQYCINKAAGATGTVQAMAKATAVYSYYAKTYFA